MIQGYPGQVSVLPGERLVLHVATDAPRFRMVFYRWADRLLPMATTDWMTGQSAPARGAADDWQWPGYSFQVPNNWPSAVYLAYLQEPGAGAFDLAYDRAAALFVVRGSGRSRLLYKIPVATYQAYNHTGGGCFYIDPPRSLTPPGSKVSLHRPGGGIGGITWGALDFYDQSSPRQTFAHWDAPFIRWLVQNGYTPEFCTDLDIHQDPGLCPRYRLVISVGHDEYWSEPTRDHMEQFVGQGGNLAFFGANLCWWRIHVVDNGSALVCHQGGPHGALDHWWAATGVNRPEDALTGVSYRHGGGWWDGPRRTTGYIVQQPDHWAFAATGLRRGVAFGAETSPPLVGYECDGAPLAHFDPATGIAALSPDATQTGTPPGFQALAVSPLGSGWQELPPREKDPPGAGLHAAVMGIFSRNGTVFTTGTTDWAQVLASGQEPRVAQVTHNVLNHLLQERRAGR